METSSLLSHWQQTSPWSFYREQFGTFGFDYFSLEKRLNVESFNVKVSAWLICLYLLWNKITTKQKSCRHTRTLLLIVLAPSLNTCF